MRKEAARNELRSLTGGRRKRKRKTRSNEGKERPFCSTLKPDLFPLACPSAALSSTKFPHRTFLEAQPILDLCPTTLSANHQAPAALRPHWTHSALDHTHAHNQGRNHSHQIRIHGNSFSTLLRIPPSSLSFLYKLLPPPHLVILRLFSFCSGVSHSKRESY